MNELFSGFLVAILAMSLTVVMVCVGLALLLRNNLLKKFLLQLACLVSSLWLIVFALKGISPFLLMPLGIFLIVVFFISIFQKTKNLCKAEVVGT